MMHKRIKRRAISLAFLFTLAFLLLAIRIFYLQVIEGPNLVRKANANLWQTTRALQPVRGTILDRNGDVLAQEAISYTLSVNPKLIHKFGVEHEVVDAIAPLLNLKKPEDIANFYKKVTEKNAEGKYYVQREVRPYGWKIDASVGKKITDAIKKKKLIGVYLLPESKRYYPYGELAAHLIGYMTKEGNAAMGLEVQYDKLLKGKVGSIAYEKDRLGYEIPGTKVKYKAPTNGDSLHLTIDSNIQSYMEQALYDVYNEYHPKNIMAIAANPKTMEILGIASLPTFNPNKYWTAKSQENFRTSAVSSVYEPGSTFKIVTLAGAVQENIFDPKKTYMSGRVRIGGYWIKDHNGGLGWGRITYLEGLKRSSNIAFVKLGYEQLGAQRLRKYIDLFGFGYKTGIDLPGESAGQISFRPEYATEVATATFGQGRVEVTAIQQLSAISAIANGGKLMRPYVVKKVLKPDGKTIVKETKPKVIRQAIKPETAHKVSMYLETVVNDLEIGTGRRAYLEGYRIAGKTGTAQKVVNGRYSTSNQYVMSFVGFAPANDPKISLIVIVDEPKVETYQQGGLIVGPLFKNIMKKSLIYLGVGEQKVNKPVTINQPITQVSDVTGFTLNSAKAEMGRLGLKYKVLGGGDTILQQDPIAGTMRVNGQNAYLLTDKPENIPLPNLIGKSMKEALRICTLLHVQVEIHGQGYVKKQQWIGSSKDRHIRLTFGALGQVSDAPIVTSPTP
jgi:penicillin-binding protein 2B